MKSKYRLGLLGKVVVAFLLVSLLPLGWISYRLVEANKDALENQVLQMHALAVDATSSRLHASVSALVTLAEATANNPSVYLDPQSMGARQLLADLLAAEENYLVAVASFNQENRVIIKAQRREIGDVIEPLFQVAQSGTVQLRSHEGFFWLIVSEPFPQGGDLRLVARVDGFMEYLNPKELGGDASMALITSEGQLAMAGTAGVEVPASLLSQGAKRQISGSGPFRQGENVVLGAYAPVPGLPWVVVSWQPVEKAHAIAGSMRRKALESVALALVITALLTFLAYVTVVRPIRRLILASEIVGGGSGDEIQKLQQAFAALERHIESYDQLEDVSLGRYQVIKKVGEGGMGMVFKGWDPQLNRAVALKTIRLDHASAKEGSKNLVVELLKEAATVANLHHSNVVTVYDAMEADDLAFVAMEYIDGCSLKQYLTLKGTLSAAEAVPLFIEIAKGIEAAHRKGILHRDIKPANILLGQDHSVKVADFGISQFMNAIAGDQDKIYGTPGYLPPETLLGQAVNQQSDLFALGVTMYRVMGGQLPFVGNNVTQVLTRTLSHVPKSLHSLNPDIPEPLSEIVDKLLEKEADRRYTEASILIADLEKLRFGHWSFEAPGSPQTHSMPNEEGKKLDELLESQFLETIALPRHNTAD